MGNCKNCKWWKEPSNWRDPEFGECLRVLEPNSLLRADGFDEGQATACGTKPDFGCVQFESKEAACPN